jgi:hypothetical protein
LSLWPGLDPAFLKVLDPCTAGDPDQAGTLWTNLSRTQIAQELRLLGFRVSVTVVAQLLKRHRLGRRKARKALPLGEHACRDRQFQIIARYREEFMNSPDPILSVDTKHKEFLGLLFRIGRLCTRQAKKALDHDFPSAALGVIYPHGLYDLKRNLGHLNLGLSHDTSRFACDSIAFWWQTHGQPAYSQARRLLLLCDGGGSNASNRYVFKYHLERLADRLGLEIRVAHDPPYCSKYNAIEHRLFPHVPRACQGLLLTSLQVAVKAMEKTSTKQGLKTRNSRWQAISDNSSRLYVAIHVQKIICGEQVFRATSPARKRWHVPRALGARCGVEVAGLRTPHGPRVRVPEYFTSTARAARP